MTVSFHKYGEFFPGTGELRDVGVGQGKHYSVNFPLRDGIDDKSYKGIFEPVIQACMDYYQPQAVVLQCGGDSLSGDRLGCFNLSMKGHANCVEFVKSFNLPTLILGGGGYTMRNVARTWAFETGLLVDKPIGPDLPYNEYYEYYAPDYELDVRPSNMDNANTAEYLEKIKNQVIENIRRTMHKPSVHKIDVPPDPHGMDDEADAMLDDADEDDNPDTRHTSRRWDLHTVKEGELSESEDEEGNARNGVRRERHSRRRNIMDYQNPNAVPDDDEILAHTNGTDTTNGLATNGDVHNGSSSHGSPTPPSSHASPPTATADDADVEMADDDDTAPAGPSAPPALPTPSAPSAPVAPAAPIAPLIPPTPEITQEATPPESPQQEPAANSEPSSETVAADPPAPEPAAAEDHLVEDVRLEAPTEEAAAEKAEGIEERETENVVGEQTKELAHEEEQT